MQLHSLRKVCRESETAGYFPEQIHSMGFLYGRALPPIVPKSVYTG
jgi:hypothetical protein